MYDYAGIGSVRQRLTDCAAEVVAHDTTPRRPATMDQVAAFFPIMPTAA
jgi:hypothetical protein